MHQTPFAIIFFQRTGASCKTGWKINSAPFFLNALRVNKPIYKPVVYFWIGKMLIAPPPPPPPPPAEPTVEWNISCRYHHHHHHQPPRCLRGLLEITGRNIKNCAAVTKHTTDPGAATCAEKSLTRFMSEVHVSGGKKSCTDSGTAAVDEQKLTFSSCQISENLFLMETELLRYLCKCFSLNVDFCFCQKEIPRSVTAAPPTHLISGVSRAS